MKIIKYILVVLIVVFLGIYLYAQANYYPPILMYHNIDKDIAGKNTIAVSADIFEKQMDFIKRHGYRVISLEALCRMIRAGEKLPHNLAVITFDDGYKDNLEAVGVLREYNFPATIFIVPNWINQPKYLTSQDLEWISNNSGVDFGSHTLNHRYLPEVPVNELAQEIFDSRGKAKQDFGLQLPTLAYPVGGFTQEVLGQVQEAGYLCACTTNRGFRRDLDIYALRRIKITDRDLGIRLWGKLTGFYNIFRRLKPPF